MNKEFLVKLQHKYEAYKKHGSKDGLPQGNTETLLKHTVMKLGKIKHDWNWI